MDKYEECIDNLIVQISTATSVPAKCLYTIVNNLP